MAKFRYLSVRLWVQKGRKNSQMACPRTCVEIRSFMTAAINKDGHARIIIMRPETILH